MYTTPATALCLLLSISTVGIQASEMAAVLPVQITNSMSSCVSLDSGLKAQEPKFTSVLQGEIKEMELKAPELLGIEIHPAGELYSKVRYEIDPIAPGLILLKCMVPTGVYVNYPQFFSVREWYYRMPFIASLKVVIAQDGLKLELLPVSADTL